MQGTNFSQSMQVLLYFILQYLGKSLYATLQFRRTSKTINVSHDSNVVSYALYICCISIG